MKNFNWQNELKRESESLQFCKSEKLTATPIQEKLLYASTDMSFRLAWLRLLVAVTVPCFLLAVAFAVFFQRQEYVKASDLTSFIIEINPKICITVDKTEQVVAICSLNDDGDVLLCRDEFLQAEGKTLEYCIRVMVFLALQYGYFENYDENITVFSVNNSESVAVEKSVCFERYLRALLDENKLGFVGIDKGCMSVKDFKNKMGLNNDVDDMDKMQEDIRNHYRYFNPVFQPSKP